MELQELIRKYQAAILKHQELSYKDAKEANKYIYIYTECYKELKQTKEGIEELKKMLGNENPRIRLTVATHLLPFYEEEAKRALKELDEAKIRFVSLDVKYILREWENGNLKKRLLSL